MPVGTVTFLFTDIEGSTRLLKLWRESYAEALADHHRILRGAFAQHEGHEIDTQGDSFFVAFRRARDAVAATVESQRRLAAQEWPDGGRVRVRMGIHTGEPAAAGERYVGLGVHRAARICAAGHGGQVLVSQTTRELLRDDPLPDISLRDLGDHALKDLDEPERLYQLVAPGLEREFPPLKATASAPFAGHEQELADAAAEEMAARRWRTPRRRAILAAAVAVGAVAALLGVLSIRGGGSTTRGVVAANSLGVIDSSSGAITSAVPLGASPSAVAVGLGAIWVADNAANTVSRIDPTTNTVQPIRVGGGPGAVATGGGAVWVADGLGGTVSRIDPTIRRTVQTIQVGNGPAGIAYGEGSVWVANSVDGTVSRIDPGSGRVRRVIPAVVGAAGIAAGFGRVWVVSPAAGVVVSLDPVSGDVVRRIGVGVDPAAVATGSEAVWIANRFDNTVSRIDPRTGAVTATIGVGAGPDAVAVAQGEVWVANGTDGTLSRIDASTRRVVGTVSLDQPPQGIAISNGNVYAPATSNGRQHKGGTLRVSAAPPGSLDPAVAYTPEAWSILSMTNDGLVAFRRVGGIQGVQLVPDLAESLPTPTDDGRSYTFVLRPGLRYSTGRPVEPADIRRAIERIFETRYPAPPAGHYYGDIVGTQRCHPGRPCDLSQGITTDAIARTVTFHLEAPDADFLTKLALTFAVAVPPGTPPHDIGRHPVPATGPYMVVTHTNRSITLRRNPRFRSWSADARPDGYPDTIVWRSRMGDSLTGVRLVEHGGADAALNLYAPPLPKKQLLTLAVRYPIELRLTPLANTTYFFMNTRVAPFDDLRVRVAVNDAFDRQRFARLLGPGFEPTCQILPPNFPAYRRFCPYSGGGAVGVARAQRLVRSSGEAGASVTVWAPAPRAVEGRFMATLLHTLGFRTRLKTLGSGNYFTRILDSRTRAQIVYLGWFSDFPSDAGLVSTVFGCSAFVEADPQVSQDPSEFCDPAVDRVLSEATAAQSQNRPQAAALWQRAERMILTQAPVVPTYNKDNVSLIARHVGNFEPNPQWGVLVDQLWVR
jgi:YVTN family beta-propeller protein